MIKLIKKLTIRKRAFKKAQQIINNQHHSTWNKWQNRQLIRLNRICASLKPFKWNGKPRRIRGVFECQVSLYNYGNINKAPSFPESVRDLIAFNKLQ